MRLMKKMAGIIERDMRMKKRAGKINMQTGEELKNQEATIEKAIQSAGLGSVKVDNLGGEDKRYLITFPNGFNLSIVSTEGSYGIEAALRINDEKTIHDKKFADVLGWLQEESEIVELIKYVSELSSDHKYYDKSYGWATEDEDEDEDYNNMFPHEMPGYGREEEDGPYGGAFRSERDLGRHLGIDYD